jgi:DNA-binding transcriptional MerR regulator/methylmalonyl-CoA mutase cobalamin-binding subunit
LQTRTADVTAIDLHAPSDRRDNEPHVRPATLAGIPHMSKVAEASGLLLNISAVERETGLSKDVLRMWERRYGFPKPGRDDNGERQYSVAEVAKLRAIKRLMDVGTRPGKIIHKLQDELDGMADARTATRREQIAPALESDILAVLQRHNASELQHTIASLLMKQGLQRFVAETLAPLNRVVGEAWMRGALQVFEEHLYTEQLQVALRTAINAFPRHSGTPRVLLTTLPGEQHGIGLLMVEALLVPETAQCISLGVQTPLDDIRRAALAHEVQVIALSFSTAFPVRQASEGLATLRRQLPADIALWAGGDMIRRIRKTLPGVLLIPDLAGVLTALADWRVAARAEHAHQD